MEPLTFAGDLDALSPIREYVKNAAASAGLEHTAEYNLLLAVDEIATNVVTHGYEEAGLKGDISVAATIDDRLLTVILSDHGASYDPHLHDEPDDDCLKKELAERPIGGLGIMLAKSSVDDLQYESTPQGNVHRFIVRRKLAEAVVPEPSVEMSDERRKLVILLRISESLGQEIKLDPLLKLIVGEVTAAMQAERSTLFLVDRSKPDELISRIAEGVLAQEIRIRVGVGIAGMTAQTRQAINIPDAYQDSRFNATFDRSSGFKTRSILSAPIVDQQSGLVGVVQVLNKKDGGCFTKEDEDFLHAICVHLGIALQRAEMVEAYLQAQIVTKSLDLAREIQMGMIPTDFALPEFKNEVDIYATMIPALEVGGDLYDFFPLDKDRICFIIGDVSGKGIPAALFMATARTAFKISAIASPESTALTMGRVNQFLCESNVQQMFVTAFAGILDLRTGEIEYADAGHEPPFIRQVSGVAREVDKIGGLVLGFLPDYKFTSGTLKLNPGETFVLYTDGVTEAMNMTREQYGAKAIERAISISEEGAGSEQIIKTLLNDMHGFVGGAHQSDDITILAIKYLGCPGGTRS
jgi:serine phosphatase RsbU (regulator of sigma subunit)/anti-sigma regulatory factor (Ser/Thr protein kinase)